MNTDLNTTPEYISIKGARVHNLKNLSVEIPRNQFIVITGLSGSGKSSLAFDTLYAEGQRRYVESLSSYARQFLGRLNKPEVDFIKGIPPAIAIEQKVNTRNPRSTVGTSTEIYDYLKLLFARIGQTVSPISGTIVKRHSVTDVLNYLNSKPLKTKALILAPLHLRNDRKHTEQLDVLRQQGFSRVELHNAGKNEIHKISDLLQSSTNLEAIGHMFIVIDRIAIALDEDSQSRFADSLQTAFFEGHGNCAIRSFEETGEKLQYFSNRFETDNMEFEEPSTEMFSFNNPLGACPKCEGYGKVLGIDPDLVIPNKSVSVYEDAIVCWRGEKLSEWKQRLIYAAPKFNFPIHRPYDKLTAEQQNLLWSGNKYFDGIDDFFKMLEQDTYKIQNRVILSRYRGKTTCPECKGTRLKKEAGYVKVNNTSIHELVLMPISDLRQFFDRLQLTENQQAIAKRILIEIRTRLEFLCDVGLGYLTLNRLSATLSGGESQRINLATSLGSSLVGSMYILDEPSIGLHSRDTERLATVLRKLQDLGNTVLVVEHDEDLIRQADRIIDIGPEAGIHGGQLVFEGTPADLLNSNSLTAKYLTNKLQIETPQKRRKWKESFKIINARANNLKNVTVEFPLAIFTVVSGVSGSGKSTLVRDIFHSAVSKHINGYAEQAGKYDQLIGDLEKIQTAEFIDQNPIGKSSRSNPVTYLKAFDDIRKLYANQQASKINGYKPAHFSFNVDGGRCEECQGEGEIKVEMQFMSDVYLQCESCKGRRFKDDILEVRYREKSIFDILELTVSEALTFFEQGKSALEKKITEKIKPLDEVGLGYIKLGQSSNTLSGGESQRVKLASFLSKENAKKTGLFVFDEPTTGLHFHDVKTLLKALNALVDRGNTVLVIEHNMDVIKSADWVIDLGPEGGENGGYIVKAGTPEDIAGCPKSYTGTYLKEKLK